MIHARQDYKRFQEPFELLRMIRRLECYIESGESLTAQDRQELILLRAKYSTLPADALPVSDDEPVFLLRAKDVYFVPMLNYYRRLLEDHPDAAMSIAMNKVILAHCELAEDWQRRNLKKWPDMPTEVKDE